MIAAIARRPALERTALIRFACAASAAATLVLALTELAYGWFGPANWRAAYGNDLAYYANLARNLFSGGQWFPDNQLHGPWTITFVVSDVLYPPAAAWVFAPFIWLPVWTLWLATIAVLAWVIRDWRPAPWTWPLMALCLLWPMTFLKVIAGTSTLFVVIAVALGLRFKWPSAFILLKPSLFPLALIGIRSRGWWIALGVIVVASLPFLRETLLYPQVILDSRNPNGALYSLVDLPIVAFPIIAWAGRKR